MIERLLLTLRALAAGGGVSDARLQRLAGDYLDAYRLIVDCPQLELGSTARAAVEDVALVAERIGQGAATEATRRAGAAAARRALFALGEAVSTGESPAVADGAILDRPQG